MKIRKNVDGKVWVYSESKKGWIYPSNEEVDPEEFLRELIKEKMQERRDLPYGMAFSEAQTEHPEIAKRYLDQLNRTRRG